MNHQTGMGGNRGRVVTSYRTYIDPESGATITEEFWVEDTAGQLARPLPVQVVQHKQHEPSPWRGRDYTGYTGGGFAFKHVVAALGIGMIVASVFSLIGKYNDLKNYTNGFTDGVRNVPTVPLPQ